MASEHNRLKLPDTINTDRLNLRAPEITDAAALQNLADNKSIYHMLASLPSPYTDEHAIDFITNLARTKDEHAYAIINDANNFIGVIGLHLNRNDGPELGYWLGEPYWGKGYASEAAKALVEAAFACGFAKIVARAITSNKGSIGVLEKCGFIKIEQKVDDCGQHQGVLVAFFERVGNK